MTSYSDLYAAAQSDIQGFWMEAAKAIDWHRPPTRALDSSRPPFHRWFPDGEMNTCHNAVDRHVAAGRGDQKAVIYDSPVTGNASSLTYAQLQEATARFAGRGDSRRRARLRAQGSGERGRRRVQLRGFRGGGRAADAAQL